MQKHPNPDYVQRARYLTLDQGFNVARTKVPAHIFLNERDEAFANGGSTHILCDSSSTMEIDVPASAPMLLASYLRIQSNEPLTLQSHASAEIFYAIRGSGTVEWANESMDWETGDVMLFPGGFAKQFSTNNDQPAILWQCTNAPQLALEKTLPPPISQSTIRPTLYKKKAMMCALVDAQKMVMKNGMKSMAIMFGTETMGSISPSLTLALNEVPPNASQVPHRHNSAAVTIVLEGEQCYSTVEGQKVPWSKFATFVTPGAASHAHFNPSSGSALVLIVQDGGLHAHCRTMGFAITQA
jgi:gentisate 1,2-dioxygenase